MRGRVSSKAFTNRVFRKLQTKQPKNQVRKFLCRGGPFHLQAIYLARHGDGRTTTFKGGHYKTKFGKAHWVAE